MIITIASPYFPYPKRGQFFGTERYTENLALALKEKGHEVRIITTYWNGSKKFENYNGIKILRVQETRNLFRKRGEIFHLHFITFGLNLYRKKVFKFYSDSDVLILNFSMGLLTKFFKIKKIPIISVFHHALIKLREIMY